MNLLQILAAMTMRREVQDIVTGRAFRINGIQLEDGSGHRFNILVFSEKGPLMHPRFWDERQQPYIAWRML